MLAAKRDSVSPACAGMIPLASNFNFEIICEPRMRGDDPESTVYRIRQEL